jgi:hypothetical protein
MDNGNVKAVERSLLLPLLPNRDVDDEAAVAFRIMLQ